MFLNSERLKVKRATVLKESSLIGEQNSRHLIAKGID